MRYLITGGAGFIGSHISKTLLEQSANVRILEQNARTIQVAANFIVHRFRRNESVRQYMGQYRYELRVDGESLKIASRVAIIDAMELGSLASVSFIL